MNIIFDKKFLWFAAKFLLLFGLLYYGTIAMIGIAAPGGYYSPFVQQHLDYVSWLKHSLIVGTRFVAGLAGYQTVEEPGFLVRIINKRGVIVAMSCVGYGVYSFWIAYMVATGGKWKQQLLWILGGLICLWLINTLRISLFLISINKNRSMPLGIDHHTWFSIWAYGFIFLMIWWHSKKTKEA